MKTVVRMLFTVLAAVLVPALPVRGATDVLAEADSAYARGNFREALALWEAVGETQGISASLMFNMGNAAFQEGDFGHAMAWWQRARRLDPGNPEIEANINYLTGRVEDANKAEQKGKNLKVSPDELSFFGAIGQAINRDHTSDFWAGWGACSFILLLVCAALYIFSRNVPVRKGGFFVGLVCGAACVVFLVFAFSAAGEGSRTDSGVVTAFKVVLATEPGKESPNGPVLTKGTLVRVVSEEQDAEGNATWRKVRLNSDYIGWLRAEDLELL